MVRIRNEFELKNWFKRNKRGQIAIYVIIAIIIVAVILILFSVDRSPKKEISVEDNPRPFMENCVSDFVKEAVEIMLPQGGYIDPKHFYQFRGDKVAFLCYTNKYHAPCINQEPLYFNHIIEEIEDYSRDSVVSCFSALEKEYEKENYNFQGKEASFEIKVVPGKILVLIERNISVSKGEVLQNYKDFSFDIISSLYEQSRAAIDVVIGEVKSCKFNYLSYMAYHPGLKITKNNIGTELTVYVIEERKSGRKLNVAIRSCAYPPYEF